MQKGEYTFPTFVSGSDQTFGDVTLTGKLTMITPAAGKSLEINLLDNTSGAVVIQEGANDYLIIGTLDAGATVDFGNAATNPVFNFLGDGGVNIKSTLDIFDTSADTDSRNTVQITVQDTLAVATTALNIVQRSTFKALNISGALTTAAFVVDVASANSLVAGGGVARFHSASVDAGARAIVTVVNNSVTATGAKCLNLQQDADQAYIAFSGISVGATVNDAFSTLTTPGAVVGAIQILDTTGTKRWITVRADPS